MHPAGVNKVDMCTFLKCSTPVTDFVVVFFSFESEGNTKCL